MEPRSRGTCFSLAAPRCRRLSAGPEGVASLEGTLGLCDPLTRHCRAGLSHDVPSALARGWSGRSRVRKNRDRSGSRESARPQPRRGGTGKPGTTVPGRRMRDDLSLFRGGTVGSSGAASEQQVPFDSFPPVSRSGQALDYANDSRSRIIRCARDDRFKGEA
jgi:hypothetical protein